MSEPDGIDPSAEVQDGVEHLQAAAHEMIAAGRAFLDAVEDVVRDREAVASVVDAFGSIAHAAGQAASQASRVATGRERSGTSSAGGDDDPPSRVQHIRVS